MMSKEYKTEILNQLEMLDTKQQKNVLNYIRILGTTKPKGIQGNKLLSFVGTINSSDLKLMKQIIEEDCEKVNLSEW